MKEILSLSGVRSAHIAHPKLEGVHHWKGVLDRTGTKGMELESL